MSEIICGMNLSAKINAEINKENTFIITDENVSELYGVKNTDKTFVLKAGEKSKTMESVLQITEKMLKAGLDRFATIVAIGGGVVGDIAGFVASIYMRGIRWENVPTTLLAQVDSSIGGKTAVDVNGYKNILGSFYLPAKIFISFHYLLTLPTREIKCGMGELFKTALLNGELKEKYSKKDYFNPYKLAEIKQTWLEANTAKLNGLFEIIVFAGEIKRGITERDFNEKGLRKILNLGHTVGHALEKCDNAKLSHGEYVLFGCLAESFIFRNEIEPNFYAFIQSEATRLLDGDKIEFCASEVAKAALSDKKNDMNKKDNISIMVAFSAGNVSERFVSEEFLLKELQEWKKELNKLEN